MGIFSCFRRREAKKTEPPILYTVIYNSENHWSILTQRLGSAWPDVLPFCVCNVMLMIMISYIDPGGEKVYLLSGAGHKFIGFVVSFLFVSRLTIALGRFNECRGHLGKMYKESRELVQNLCTITAVHQDQKSKEWRAEVAYRTMLFLRTAMAILNYGTDGIPNWKVPELNGTELSYVMENLLFHPQNSHYAILPRSEYEENMRVPILVGLLLRKSIVEHAKRLPEPLAVPLELKLLSSADACVAGFTGLRKFSSTPVPFPLVQMARTFLFLYLYSIPLILVADESSLIAHCFAVFLMTYGFMGLEMIAIALDDPFGDDPIDFKCLALAHTAFEDTYLNILDIDGEEWADFLRFRMNDDINERLTTEQSWLLGGKERFHNLMMGDTEYKRESEYKAKLEREQKLQQAKAAEKKAEKKEKKKLKVKNPLKSLSPKSATSSPKNAFGNKK